MCLISIWRDHKIQDQLDGTCRNQSVLKAICDLMAAKGYERSVVQIKNKMKKLRSSFRKAEDSNRRSGRGRASCRYYTELSDILAGRPETQPVHLIASVDLETPPVREAEPESPDPLDAEESMDQTETDEELDDGETERLVHELQEKETEEESVDSVDTPLELGWYSSYSTCKMMGKI